jgi:PAS domain S-box-containing protein
MLLMTFRPTITVVEAMSGKMSFLEDLITEWLSLTVSILLLAGIRHIAPLFRTFVDALEGLRESEDRYRSLFENSIEGVLLTTTDGRVLAANPAARGMFDMTSDEIIGTGPDRLLGEPLPGVRSLWDPDGRGFTGVAELTGTRKDGSRFPVEASCNIFKDRNGEECFCAVLRDTTLHKEAEAALEKSRGDLEQRVAARTWELTRANRRLQREIEERKHAEQALKASEHKYRALVENIHDAVYIRDLDGFFTFVTPQAERITGYTRQELLRMTFRDLLDPECIPSAERTSARLAAGETPGIMEITIRHADGHAIPIETFASPLRCGHTGEVIAIQGLARDITRRKQAEAQRTLLATAIHQAEEGIIITDAQGLIEYANPAFERISGFAHMELIHRNISLVESGKHPQDYYGELLDTLARGQVWKGHLINRRKDGSFFEVDATISPIRDQSGRIVHHVAIEHDVTLAVQLEQQLRRAQKMEAVGTLAGGIAHDFNNFLATIIGQAELAAACLPEHHSVQHNLKILLKASYHAKDVLRQIFSLGRRRLNPVQVPLILVVREVIRLLRPTLPENIIVLADETGPKDAFPVMADPTQMQQVLMNLCTNAVHSMCPEGGTLRVELGEETIDRGGVEPPPVLLPGSYVTMTVTDTGHGIEVPEHGNLDRVFEPFYTTKASGKGTGLGLTVVHAIVSNHGGVITVRSEPGLGSCFRVYLPKKP